MEGQKLFENIGEKFNLFCIVFYVESEVDRCATNGRNWRIIMDNINLEDDTINRDRGVN